MKILVLLITMIFAMPAMAHAACTEMGCRDGVTLTLGPDIIKQVGYYDLVFSLDRRKVTCKGHLPLEPCEEGATFRCDSPAVQIIEQGCARKYPDQGIPEIFISGMPRKVVMILNRDKKQVLIRTLRPVYLNTRPNGPLCEPECIQSTVPVSLRHHSG